ncbi:M20/M25/M40 family metallo-hydrolase [Arthrobacter sp. 4R501]|uniref:M20/M25/M40 family metallo-hydrolase n=1 Tax=Arthrobacter sp. 4R501 TaxID=2058886 RepID=UPI0021580758|nr:M20/M25/M40 family metallo-hydrolase [Arthrobacter sp. 4R501]
MGRSADVVAALGTKLLGRAPQRINLHGVPHLSWKFEDTAVLPRHKVLLLCHHDTVWPLGSWGSGPVSRLDMVDGETVLRGPGSFDMKTGIIQGLYALRALQMRGLGLAGVQLLVTGDEETGSRTSRALIEEAARECAAVLVLEASAGSGLLKSARKGVSIYELKVTGRAAHAGLEPEKGVNVVVELAHQVLQIGALADPDRDTTVTPTLMNAGTTTNTVAAAGTLSIDVRAWTGEEQARVDDALRSLAAVLPGARLELLGGINRVPLEESMSAPVLALAQSVAAELGLGLVGSVHVGGASDGNFTAGMGVPTLDGLGAVGGGAHAHDEHVIPARMPERTALIAGLVEAVLSNGVVS